MSLSIRRLFTAASPVPGQHVPVCTGLGAIILMGSENLFRLNPRSEKIGSHSFST